MEEALCEHKTRLLTRSADLIVEVQELFALLLLDILAANEEEEESPPKKQKQLSDLPKLEPLENEIAKIPSTMEATIPRPKMEKPHMRKQPQYARAKRNFVIESHDTVFQIKEG
ncbi:Uncharacterized protein Fot_39114 [Forsythia ovata]|uniref:Uncharacterized protein n=1 Tax=Forsythia ovata TaxID=205694 RepID=A0ABD1S3P8_9LAMI